VLLPWCSLVIFYEWYRGPVTFRSTSWIFYDVCASIIIIGLGGGRVAVRFYCAYGCEMNMISVVAMVGCEQFGSVKISSHSFLFFFFSFFFFKCLVETHLSFISNAFVFDVHEL
jgi:hypothetical protein